LLSYRHSFHAGNFADVIKHIVLVEILQHVTQKDSPFEYIDTHSGAGLFNFESNDAKKLQEYQSGIAKLDPKNFPELERYFEIINFYNPAENLTHYPGSPSIATDFLRPQDRAWLFELHPQDYKLLCNNLSGHKKIRINCADGLKQLNALMPPTSRRAVVLIDPSYEIKDEYEWVFEAIVKAYMKFSTGIYALWYPVVERKRIDILEQQFKRSGIKNIQRFELGLSADSYQRGMTAAGIFVINPPWKLFDFMSTLLPKLAGEIGEGEQPLYKCDVLSAE